MKIENMSPYLRDNFLNEFVRFLTSRQGRDPAIAKQGGPGGKFDGRMEALIQSAMMTTSIATSTDHIFFLYNLEKKGQVIVDIMQKQLHSQNFNTEVKMEKNIFNQKMKTASS